MNAEQSDLVKPSALRLLGNLCEHKETAVPIVQTPGLLDTVCGACQHSSTDVQRNAIRTIRLLVSLSNSFAKVGNIFDALKSSKTVKCSKIWHHNIKKANSGNVYFTPFNR